MNKKEKSRLYLTLEQLQQLSAEFELLADNEQNKLDNLPENLQESEKANAIQEVIDNLESAKSNIESAIEDTESIINQ